MTPDLALLVWAASVLAWVVIRLPYQRRARRVATARDARTVRDRAALGAATIGLVGVPAVFALTHALDWASPPFQPWLAAVGAALAAAFLLLFVASHRQLGRNWSVSLEIRTEHTLVTDGLYRWVRHPMYSSFWLWALSQLFLVQNGIAGPSGLVGVAILYAVRVGPEERMMRERFGDAYDTYARRTGRVVPRLG